jgi:hypothetical protein
MPAVCPHRDFAESGANAHLQAAAPELLEALKATLAVLQRNRMIRVHGVELTEYGEQCLEAIEAAKNAISKAEEVTP